MPKNHAEKYHLAMSGEFFVVAHLQRLGVSASVTYGNAKSADVLAFTSDSDRVVVVEVKTTRQPKWTFSGRILTKSEKPWVFVHLPEDSNDPPKFYILTQSDLYGILGPADEEYCKIYKEKHGVEYGDKPWIVNINLEQLTEYRNHWEAIVCQLQSHSEAQS